MTDNYPDEPPNYTIKGIRDTTSSDVEEAKMVVERVIERNLGSHMVFDMIDALREWLGGNVEEA